MRILFFENHKARGKRISVKILAYLVAICIAFSGISFVNADSFDDQIAKNGTGFTPVPDNEKTAFLVFGSKATKADGMQGRWKMLTKEQMVSINDYDSANAVFGTDVNVWSPSQDFSAYDGQNFILDNNVSGISIENLASNYDIDSIYNKVQLVAIGRDGRTVYVKSYLLDPNRYYFPRLDSNVNDTGVYTASPLIKVENGVFSLRLGQLSPTETTYNMWKNDIKTLQIDSVTTATVRSDIVLTVKSDKATYDYTMSDVVDAGEYNAKFAYYNKSGKTVIATVRGARLKDLLAQRSIVLTSGDKTQVQDNHGTTKKLSSPVTKYFVAYEGRETVSGESAVKLNSDSEFCLFGPGRSASTAKMSGLYTIKITRASNPTKITKLVKKGKRAIRIKWAKRFGVSGYQIKMATKKNGKYRIIKTVKKPGTTTFTKKKLKKGKKYFFKVRTYKKVNGKTYYSKWSAAKYKKL